jgi:hypothetical protein
MANQQVFIFLVLFFVTIVLATILVSKYWYRIKRVISNPLDFGQKRNLNRSYLSDRSEEVGQPKKLTAEESKAELKRLQKLIEEQKRIASECDISYHLWGLYKNYFRNLGSQSFDQLTHDGEWYDIKINRAGTMNGVNRFEFSLKGANYKFVDDEEMRGWSDKTKFFSLFLYDDSGRCLIEVPMKVSVDKWGRHYSISSDGPKAFIPNGWISDFINVKLKHQHLRNQEITAQKHQERLREIRDLKERFGIVD